MREIVTGKTTKEPVISRPVTRDESHPWLYDVKTRADMLSGKIRIPHSIHCTDCRRALTQKYTFNRIMKGKSK